MWDAINQYTDTAIYFWIGGTATLLFMLKMGLELLGGGDDAGDFEVGTGDDLEFHADTEVDFKIFSVLSIVAFFMGAGWFGLTARLQWALTASVALIISLGAGFLMMTFAAGGLYFVRKLKCEPRFDPSTAVGRSGRVYLTIPPKGEGRGQVQVIASGKKKVIAATNTTDRPLKSFTSIKVTQVMDDGSLLVEPAE